jgi:UDP-2,3-diacylglucosamine pyrophosphatase LpxH
MKTIFLSDIHIGTNCITNLYQQKNNEANLKRVLSYIQAQGDQVRDVVVLGDWIDLWMYPSSVVPPSAQQIFEANPGVFTKQTDGDFVSVMDGVHGDLVYVNGNHDITVTEQDVNGWFAPLSQKGRKVRCVGPGGYDYSFYLVHGEHGNLNSMVCRPYRNEALPFGYYMTRAGMQNIVVSQKDLPPLNVLAVQELISYNGLTFAQAMMTFQANQIGYSKIQDLVFTMPDGSTIAADAVATKFPNLNINMMEFLRVDVGGSLNAAAYDRLTSSSYRVLVLGHTHIKELFSVYNKLYANSGFMCAGVPDQNGVAVSSFVEVEERENPRTYTVSLMKIDQAGTISVDKTMVC